jgi:hypothetical protein
LTGFEVRLGDERIGRAVLVGDLFGLGKLALLPQARRMALDRLRGVAPIDRELEPSATGSGEGRRFGMRPGPLFPSPGSEA